jgi:hypothetical protein
MITISKSELAKGIPIPQGWKEFNLTEVVAKPSKDGGSVNYFVLHALKDDVNGRVIQHNFNSKALSMMAPFIAALAGKTVNEVITGMDSGEIQFDLESVVGKTVLGKVEPQEYQGRILSKVTDWAAVGSIPF